MTLRRSDLANEGTLLDILCVVCVPIMDFMLYVYSSGTRMTFLEQRAIKTPASEVIALRCKLYTNCGDHQGSKQHIHLI